MKKKLTPIYWENVYTGLKRLFYIWIVIIVILGLMYSCGYHAGKTKDVKTIKKENAC